MWCHSNIQGADKGYTKTPFIQKLFFVKAENQASSSLQDGATEWLYFLKESSIHPPPEGLGFHDNYLSMYALRISLRFFALTINIILEEDLARGTH